MFKERYKSAFPFILISISVIGLFLGSWSIFHNDIYFISDIARDFLLFEEIREKFIILIGPRSSGMPGLFHGVLWLYLNFPAYLIGNGNPVVLGWFWILLVIIFSFIYYFFFKNIFSKTIALVFVTLFVLAIAHYVDQFYNPIGALLVMPLVYYFMYQYLLLQRIKDGILLFFLVGIVIQFQMAVGIPVLLLVLFPFLYKIIKTNKFIHLLIPLSILIPLSSFLIFELKHNFVQTKIVLQNVSEDTRSYTAYDVRISDRLFIIMESGLGFFHNFFEKYNKYIGIFLGALLIKFFWKERDLKRGLLIYFYVGFYILSFFHNGKLLSHYILPLILLPILFLAASYKKIPSQVYWIFISLIVSINMYSLVEKVRYYEDNQHRWQYWKSLNTVFDTIEKTRTQDKVGVFIYAPDVYAYGPKYAFFYNKKHNDSFEYIYNTKLRETYLLYEPPPVGQTQFDGTDWRVRQVNISKEPVESIMLQNGYRIEKYILTEEEQNIEHDQIIDDIVSQR